MNASTSKGAAMKPLVLSLSVACIAAACSEAPAAPSPPGRYPAFRSRRDPGDGRAGRFLRGCACANELKDRLRQHPSLRLAIRQRALRRERRRERAAEADEHLVARNFASWSPDGRRIAFRKAGGRPEVYVVSTDGSGSGG